MDIDTPETCINNMPFLATFPTGLYICYSLKSFDLPLEQAHPMMQDVPKWETRLWCFAGSHLYILVWAPSLATMWKSARRDQIHGSSWTNSQYPTPTWRSLLYTTSLAFELAFWLLLPMPTKGFHRYLKDHLLYLESAQAIRSLGEGLSQVLSLAEVRLGRTRTRAISLQSRVWNSLSGEAHLAPSLPSFRRLMNSRAHS